MFGSFKLIILFSFCSSLLLQGGTKNIKSIEENHFRIYSILNSTLHENIDDRKTHHSHKHSENGDEHSHEHNTISHYDLNYLNQEFKLDYTAKEIVKKTFLILKNLISSPHPFSLFRPPIYLV